MNSYVNEFWLFLKESSVNSEVCCLLWRMVLQTA